MVRHLNNSKLEVASKLAELMQSAECTPRERLRAIALFVELNELYALSDYVITYEPVKSPDELELIELEAERSKLLAAKALKQLSMEAIE